MIFYLAAVDGCNIVVGGKNSMIKIPLDDHATPPRFGQPAKIINGGKRVLYIYIYIYIYIYLIICIAYIIYTL